MCETPFAILGAVGLLLSGVLVGAGFALAWRFLGK